ncbi:MAG: lysine exporter protein [Actinobacteria bacterium]|nr:MAG: lysine exporter protein [Actinomycetota bacterium]
MPNVFAFLTYVAVTTFTPGPNNIMSMSNASRFGFRRSMRFTWGVGAGFFLVVGSAIAFTIVLYRVIPTIKPVMTVIGAAYILWLAWKTLTTSLHDEDAAGQSTFLSGMLLQFLNPKAILYGITVASTFIVPYYHSTIVQVGFAAALALVSVVSTSCWALFGSVFRRFMAKNQRVVGYVMAALLVYCAVSLFL